MSSGSVAETPGVKDKSGDGIAGLSTLKGLVLYGAVLTFAGLYIYFAVKISSATTAPDFGTTLTGAAAALAGILGSAFALEIGVPSGSRPTNKALGAAVANAETQADGAMCSLLSTPRTGRATSSAWRVPVAGRPSQRGVGASG